MLHLTLWVKDCTYPGMYPGVPTTLLPKVFGCCPVMECWVLSDVCTDLWLLKISRHSWCICNDEGARLFADILVEKVVFFSTDFIMSFRCLSGQHCEPLIDVIRGTAGVQVSVLLSYPPVAHHNTDHEISTGPQRWCVSVTDVDIEVLQGPGVANGSLYEVTAIMCWCFVC